MQFRVAEAMERIPQTAGYTRRLFHQAFGCSPRAYLMFLDSRGSFRVMLYSQKENVFDPGSGQTQKAEIHDEKGLLAFCRVPRTRAEIVEFLAIASSQYALHRYLDPLVQAGKIRLELPDKPRSPKQRFITAEQ